MSIPKSVSDSDSVVARIFQEAIAKSQVKEEILLPVLEHLCVEKPHSRAGKKLAEQLITLAKSRLGEVADDLDS